MENKTHRRHRTLRTEEGRRSSRKWTIFKVWLRGSKRKASTEQNNFLKTCSESSNIWWKWETPMITFCPPATVLGRCLLPSRIIQPSSGNMDTRSRSHSHLRSRVETKRKAKSCKGGMGKASRWGAFENGHWRSNALWFEWEKNDSWYIQITESETYLVPDPNEHLVRIPV